MHAHAVGKEKQNGNKGDACKPVFANLALNSLCKFLPPAVKFVCI